MANEIRDQANEEFRAFETDGVPSSGAHKPVKTGIRRIFSTINDRVEDHEGRIGTAETGLAAETALRQAGDAALSGRIDSVENIAYTSANVYETVAAGLAATSDGQQFQVDSGKEIIRYRRDSASVATVVARYPNASILGDVTALARNLNLTDRDVSMLTPTDGVDRLIQDEPSALALDFTDLLGAEAKIIDPRTPANNYVGKAGELFTFTHFPGLRYCVQQDGSLRYQAHNRILGSIDFTGWTLTGASLALGKTGPDGVTSDAAEVTATGANCIIARQANASAIVGGAGMAAFCAKAGTGSWAYVEYHDGTARRAWFDLKNGQVGTVDAGLTAAVYSAQPDGTLLDYGFYICAVTRIGAASTGPTIRISLVDGDGSTTVTAGRTLTIARPQAHRGLKLLDYLPTSATEYAHGIPFDWRHGFRAALIEVLGTNYRGRWSDDLTKAEWVKSGVVASFDAVGPHDETCSTVRATADNSTVLQTGTTLSTLHQATGWIKRKSGSGRVWLVLNDVEIECDLTDKFKRFGARWTGTVASDAVYGLKFETAGDEVEVSLLNTTQNSLALNGVTASDHPVYATPLVRSPDNFQISLSRFGGGDVMTAYFDAFTDQETMPTVSNVTFNLGFRPVSGGYSVLGKSGTHVRIFQAAGGPLSFSVLGDYEPGRFEATLRVEANNHGGSYNGFGAGYGVAIGELPLDNLYAGGGSFWLRRLLAVPRAVPDNQLERWRYSGEGRDPRYLDDVSVARDRETEDVRTQREPALSNPFWDNSVNASGFISWMEKGAISPSHLEMPARFRALQWTVDKATKRITLGDKITLVEPDGWNEGRGHIQSPAIIKQTFGPERGRTWVLWTQLDTPDGLFPPDHRRVYAAYSDDNLKTLSTPTVIYDRGPGVAVLTGPIGDVVEYPSDSEYPGRLVVPFYATTSPAHGVLYRDPDGEWTVGATSNEMATANEPTLALRPDGTMLMTARYDTGRHFYAIISDGGLTFGTPAQFTSGSFDDAAYSLSQMDVEGGRGGRYGKMLLVGAREGSPLNRSGLSIEELVGQPPVLSGKQYRPIGSYRMAGYATSIPLEGGLLLVGYEDSEGANFNSRCSIRLMLIDVSQL